MLAVMSAIAPLMGMLITGERERALDHLIGEPPIAAVDIQVVRTALQKNSKWLRLELPDQSWITITAAQADISSDGAENAAEGLGPFPGSGEGSDRAGARAADAAVVAARAQSNRATIGGALLLDG